METHVIRTTGELPRAAEILEQGGMCAVPTETVYGLCVNGLSPEAVAALYEIKGRPEVKPLALMIPDAEAMERYGQSIPPAAKKLAERFWPGPLTIIVPAREDIVPAVIRAGGKSIGFRCPDHPLTLALLGQLDFPLAGPSANPSGAPSPKSAEDVLGYFDGQIGAVLDGGVCGLGRESTVLDMSALPYRILRQGALSAEDIGDALRETLTVVGITGGTGSGKTTALNMLRELGALILDCDEIYHELLAQEGEMVSEILVRFPEAAEGGKLVRKKLGGIVFADPAALLDLNAITHRHVNAEVARRLAEHARRGGTLAAIDAIALLESGLGDTCRCTVAVTAPAEQRVARLIQREGIREEYARARIAAQKSDEWFRERCTYTLENSGSRTAFEAACRELFANILKSE